MNSPAYHYQTEKNRAFHLIKDKGKYNQYS
jgi:hypothetical protein